MALQTLEKLIQGDSSIVEAFQNVRTTWTNLLVDFDWNAANALDKMAELVSQNQLLFEYQAGERWLGQEIMVIVGIGQFYSSSAGFELNIKRAKLIKDAFLLSYCSIEVKGIAEDIANLYSLNDKEENPRLTGHFRFS